MMMLGAVVAFFVAQGDAVAPVEDDLRRARNEYAYGNYQEAAQELRALLYPMKLATDAQVIEARKYLALSCYLLNESATVQEEFAKLLYLDPDYELDPFSVAPPVIERFEAIRRELKSDLDTVRRSKRENRALPTSPGVLRVVHTHYVERSDVLSLLPFGVGQMQNGDVGWAMFFGISELGMLATNVGCYLTALSMHHYSAAERGTVQVLTVAQYTSLALLGALWSAGALHARINFVAGVSEPPVVYEEPLNLAPHGGLNTPWGATAVARF